ncbi:MAG: glycoside hydrolase domain-containing protein [Muribaculaceae bacterium]
MLCHHFGTFSINYSLRIVQNKWNKIACAFILDVRTTSSPKLKITNDARSIKFIVEARGNSPKNIYIQKVMLNGKPYNKSYITYHELLQGGTLTFVMGAKPNKKFGSAPSARPRAVNSIL